MVKVERHHFRSHANDGHAHWVAFGIFGIQLRIHGQGSIWWEGSARDRLHRSGIVLAVALFGGHRDLVALASFRAEQRFLKPWHDVSMAV